MPTQVPRLVLLLLLLVGRILPLEAASQSLNNIAYSRTAPPVASGQSATLLPDGRWLLLGGEDSGGLQARAMVKDIHTNEIRPLTTQLGVARAWHSATVLPDGSVLILGGVGAGGTIVSTAERFAPQTGVFQTLPDTGLIPRARHTATLLTDGRVLVVGGVWDKGRVLSEAELWNPRTATSEPFKALLDVARYGHAAALLPSDPVLLWGAR